MKKRFMKYVPLFLFATFLPLATFAQTAVPRPTGSGGGAVGLGYSCDSLGGSGLFELLCRVHQLLSNVLPVLVALGVVYLVWGVITYVIADDTEAKTTGRDRIIFGIVGLAVIVSVWGLVALLTNTFRTRGYGIESDELRDLVPR